MHVIGLIMSLTDTVGSLAVASKGQYMTGVSVNISTSFVKPGGRIGDILHAKGVVTGMGEDDLVFDHNKLNFISCACVGKSLAYTRVDFFDAKGALVAYGGTVF